jgi:hypothetical protein
MAQWFRRKPTKNLRTSYTYKPQDSLSGQEKQVYARVIIVLILIVGISIALYFWGVQIVLKLSSFWNVVGSEDTANSQTNISSNEPIFAPRIDPITSPTSKDKLDLRGWSQPGSEVKLFHNSKEVATVLADRNGRYEYNGLVLVDGENEIYGITTLDSKVSEPSETQKVELDTKYPDLTTTYDESKVAEEGKVIVAGKTEPNAEVYVNDHRVILQADGSYSYEYTLSEGANHLLVKAVDAAGNENKKEKDIEYKKPDTPTPNP